MDHVDNLREKMLALKVSNGRTLNKFLESFAVGGCYKGVSITKSESDDLKFEAFRSQFFQALHDNVVQRFPSTDILTAARVLNKALWPKDPLQKALDGENEVAS